MMRIRFSFLHKNQRGLTLVELLIAILLAGIVTAGITITIGHMFAWTTRTNNHMTAVRQVQSAGYWVSRDVLQSQPSKIVSAANGEFLRLGWVDSDNLDIVVLYVIEDAKLKRSYTVDGTTTSTYIAQFIDPDQTSFDIDGSKYIFTVRANVGAGSVHERTETRQYHIDPRPDG